MPGLLPLLAVVAATTSVDVPDTFGTAVDKVADRSGVAVLLPETLPTPFKKVYPDAFSRAGTYGLYLGAAKGCNGSTACFVAGFMADDEGERTGGTKVKLAKRRTGYFTKSTCGASCAPAQMQWTQKGVLYTISVKDLTGFKSDKAGLRKLANSAIRRGDRAG